MTPIKLNRRQALKTMIATAGGLGSLAFLPEKWLKPVVKSGVLPVHALSSGMGVTGLVYIGEREPQEGVTINAYSGNYIASISALKAAKPTATRLAGSNTTGVDGIYTILLEPGDYTVCTDSVEFCQYPVNVSPGLLAVHNIDITPE